MHSGESFLNQSALCGAKAGFGSLTFKEGGEKVARIMCNGMLSPKPYMWALDE